MIDERILTKGCCSRQKAVLYMTALHVFDHRTVPVTMHSYMILGFYLDMTVSRYSAIPLVALGS